MMQYRFKLYIAGQTPKSKRAIANLKRICDNNLREEYIIDIVDLLERPQIAEEERILATPTLVKVLPMPIRRMIGDLSDTETVLMGLDLDYSLNQKDEKE